MIKVGRNRPTGTFTQSSNNMKTVGTIHVFNDMKDHGIYENVKLISKDRNNKSNKYLKEIGSSTQIRFDLWNLRKTFKISLEDFVKSYKSFTYFDGKDEIEVENPLEKVSEHLLHERVCMWLSTVDHLLGNHNNCKHKNDQDGLEKEKDDNND